MYAFILVAALPLMGAGESVELSTERYLDKCKGAWAGQMVGVSYGWPFEFVSNGKPITDPLEAWKPEKVAEAINQDDIYVEMTFLQSLEQHGPAITPVQAGEGFGASEYDLWHANKQGRNNIRAGIVPPMSGHPDNNPHADDIDFQIEADLFGILCPVMPQTSNKLCDVFGRIMNYGDGVYGGMFVAGMYAAAYAEDKDVAKVVQAGLDTIPAGSTYAACIRDVIQWHGEHPTDWLAAWKKIEDKWQDDSDCMKGDPVNIDAKLNGAYIVMGLLYGGGDFAKTLEIATRCGQDADCNPSNAAGVLGCMKGFSGIEPVYTSGIDAIRGTNFAFTQYNFDTLIAACQRVTSRLVTEAGGTVSPEGFTIPAQAPQPPATLEQWIGRYAKK